VVKLHLISGEPVSTASFILFEFHVASSKVINSVKIKIQLDVQCFDVGCFPDKTHIFL
jgi:hypothetical protein